MVIKIIVTILFIILAIVLYFLFVPILFRAGGDFDKKFFRVALHDPLGLVSLRYDTSLDEKFSLKILYFINPLGSSENDEEKPKKKKKQKPKKKTDDGKKKGKKSKLKDFIRKKAKIIIKSLFSFLKKCRIHVSDCDISFSTGEPDTSALLYGGLSSLPFMYGRANKVNVDLMSDDAFVRGHIKVSGSIFICILLYYVLKILFTKGE